MPYKLPEKGNEYARAWRRKNPERVAAINENRGHGNLTPRESEVLLLLCSGMTGKQAAHAMGVSVSTIGLHSHHIIKKAGARKMVQAALYFMGPA